MLSNLIDRDVFQYQLISIAEEMSASLKRSAFSPIIWDMLDYSCALLSPQGELLAQAETIPAQLGVLSYAFEGITREIPLHTWRSGDVLICNDPYRGCTHTPDIVLMSPVFHEGAIIAVTATVAHHVDIGGKLPSTTAPDNLEVFAEGLLFPPMRLVKEGVQNDTVFRFIAGNVRNPRACSGDLIAQIAGCRTGEKRLGSLVARYGAERFAFLMDEILGYGERFMRNAIERIPDGVHTAEILIEDDVSSKTPIAIRVTVRVEGDRIQVDYAGTDGQRKNALNCPLASTYSMTLYALRCMTGLDTPANGGCSRAVTITVPDGSFLNPRRPAAVGNRHFAQQGVAEVVLKAMADVLPDHTAAGCHISFPTFRAGGLDTRAAALSPDGTPRYFIIHDIIGGGMGGHSDGDGLSAVDTHGGNCGVLAAEIVETISPVRIRRSELVTDSGGPGRHRGGLAMRRDYELLCDDLIVSVFFQQGSSITAPWGARGGANGRPAMSSLRAADGKETALSTKQIALPARRGDIIRLESAGGGGWGPASERSAEKCRQDAINGYVSTTQPC
ncbi:hydantoinase B/oxoprolinase family protein [Castellaniella sp.]|uniref:hydantoinase B/oxoprolinase family protein n=1 Tax=Castellaniella sp. TaxID=1955812 RepID=UPI003C714D81